MARQNATGRRCDVAQFSALAPNAIQSRSSNIGGERPVSHDQLRRLILVRQLRATIIGKNLFADPAWDILLSLYAADLAGARVSVAEHCNASDVPMGTAERWITALADQGLARVGGPLPRASMSLSPTGSAVMSRYFTAVSTTILPF